MLSSDLIEVIKFCHGLWKQRRPRAEASSGMVQLRKTASFLQLCPLRQDLDTDSIAGSSALPADDEIGERERLDFAALCPGRIQDGGGVLVQNESEAAIRVSRMH